MPKRDRLKKPKAEGSKRLQPAPEVPSSNKQKPLFSFRFIEQDFCTCKTKQDDNGKIWTKIEGLSQHLAWEDIQKQPREKWGTEIIPRTIIKKQVPTNVPDSVEILAFHTNGYARIIGYRSERIFYVLWLDCNGDIYDH